MPKILDSQGLSYESLVARLLGNPEESPRNEEIRTLRAIGCLEAAIKAYWEAYDRSQSLFHAIRHDDGIFGLQTYTDQSGRRGGASLPNPVPSPAAAVHPAN